MASETLRRPGRLSEERRQLLVRGLHVTVLWAAALAQPLFDLLGGNAAFFAIRRNEAVDIVVLAVALIVVVPLVLLALEALAALIDTRLSRGLHLLFVAVLVALFAIQALEPIISGASGPVQILVAVLVGVGAAAAYHRARGARMFLTAVSPAPLVFLVAFLVFSPVSKLVFAGEEDVAIASVAARSPVVMIVFDQLPATSLLAADGSIDSSSHPNFASFAKRSYWFRNTAATSDLTELAVPAILTGKRPRPEDLPLLRDHPQNAFTLFGRSHVVRATEATTSLCPPQLCAVESPGFTSRMRSLASDLSVVAAHMVLPADLRGGLPSITGKWQDFGESSPDRVAATSPAPLRRLADAKRAFTNRREIFSGFVDSIGRTPSRRPPLHFLHSMVPHYDFEYLPSGRNYANPSTMPGLEEGRRWTNDAPLVERAHQRHLLQVGFVDRLLGDLLRRLRATGMYDRSLIVVTADHGATFRPGRPFLGTSGATPPDMLPVPLFIKAPRQRQGRTVDAHLQTIDILPTVAQLLRFKIPWKVDGRSGLGAGSDRRVGLLHHPGERPRRFSFDWFDATRAQALRRKVELFGGAGGVFGMGPRPELLGRPLSDFPTTSPNGLRAQIDVPELFSTVDLRSSFRPAHVTGELSGPGAGVPRDLAIAVNGRVAAVARTARAPGSQTPAFSVMVPEASLRQENRVQVLAVSAAGGRVSLAPLASTPRRPARFSLADGEIRVVGGPPIQVAGEAIKGFVDATTDLGDGIRFDGWAIEPRDRRPVDRILAFAGGTLAYAGAPQIERRDIEREYKTSTGKHGFRFAVNDVVLQRARRRVQVFAVSGRTASPVPFRCEDGAELLIGC